ncbi:FRG domain-containing protein [Methanobrevibacter woesei]|uniref:FRG domain-containing protein n=1 Tax=Methanobrevibacter woesei TaxID=190976 RepID=UPI0032093097
MKNENKNELKYEDLIKIHYIKSYQELLNIITGKSNFNDLRKNFIFRGLKKENYKLIPSSLRKNDEGNFIITDFIIGSEFLYNKENPIKIENKDGFCTSKVDKNDKNIKSDKNPEKTIYSSQELQFRRETYVLLQFLNYTDKIGLKIPANENVRKWLHNPSNYKYDYKTSWPNSDFFEIISLAQHYGIPTRALDWTYDYKIAIYFAVEDILKNEKEDCVLWAFNYKLFEDHYQEENYEKHKLIIYRPEYNSNPNLSSQKGLFTFWIIFDDENKDDSDNNDFTDETPFEEIIINYLIDNQISVEKGIVKINGYNQIYLSENDVIFHKFIIPGNLKLEIINNLYLDGYSKEYIYPSYNGVVNSIKDRAIIDNMINKDK